VRAGRFVENCRCDQPSSSSRLNLAIGIVDDSPTAAVALQQFVSSSDVLARLKSCEPGQAGPKPSLQSGLRGLRAWLHCSEAMRPWPRPRLCHFHVSYHLTSPFPSLYEHHSQILIIAHDHCLLSQPPVQDDCKQIRSLPALTTTPFLPFALVSCPLLDLWTAISTSHDYMAAVHPQIQFLTLFPRFLVTNIYFFCYF